MPPPKTQWHPLFGRLFRQEVAGYYDMMANPPVGDVPREADFVLRRKPGIVPPFSGVWRHLTTWNTVEYKGPTVTPRRDHLPLLVEVGLGIYRRLKSDAAAKGRRAPPAREASFWYLANRLGRRYLQTAGRMLGGVEPVQPGVWKGACLDHPLSLVSAVELPVDEESLPLHILAREPLEREVAVGEFVIETAERFYAYGSTFAALHPAAWQEVKKMAKAKRKRWEIDLRPLVEEVGLEKVIQQIGKKEVIDQIGKKEFIDQLGKKDVLDQMDVDDILDNLTPAKRRELARRLNST